MVGNDVFCWNYGFPTVGKGVFGWNCGFPTVGKYVPVTELQFPNVGMQRIIVETYSSFSVEIYKNMTVTGQICGEI